MGTIGLAQDRNRWRAVVNAVMNLRVSQNAENFLSNWGPGSLSGMTLLHGVRMYLFLWITNSCSTIVCFGQTSLSHLQSRYQTVRLHNTTHFVFCRQFIQRSSSKLGKKKKFLSFRNQQYCSYGQEWFRVHCLPNANRVQSVMLPGSWQLNAKSLQR
jgi:hypothetical protein